MRYSMVKQFSNGALDNIYNFVFKWVDFGKVLLEAFWSFFEIWQAFFLIFYNMFMYVYYLLLFVIDRGAEETQSTRLFRKIPTRSSSVPRVHIPNVPNPIPAMYGRVAESSPSAAISSAAKATTETVKSFVSPPRKPLSGAGGKRSILKILVNFFSDFFYSLKNFFLKPAKALVNFFADRVKPVREQEHPAEPQKRSLIDEYIKEYEQRKQK
ncbi:MAG: hypothetical protein CVV44_00210 [Spirochaetae bacterium HGW-Spirochaetae-1]|jgi:hypothetical protein|nr:MAG: hypothetical protein CVV44_00210 [Spirochaetae bacterium HGW-Spirochaetae-1]